MHTFKICDECGVKDLSDNLQLFPLEKKKKKKKKKKNGNENVRQPFVQHWGYKQRAIVSIPFMSLCVRKSTILVSDQVRHKPGCTITMLEFVFISRRGNALSV